ncbi:MAG: hypothetical protein ACPHCN_18510 [Mycobacterium sp.]
MSKKKPPNKPMVITLRVPPAFAEKVRKRCAELAKSSTHGHRKWSPSDLCREGLALVMAETEGAE